MNTTLNAGLKWMLTGLACAALLAPVALAGVPAGAGNIDAVEKYAWSENAGWINFNATHGGVTVQATYLSGFAWSETVGWIKLGADAGGPYVNTTATNWGVNRDALGGLSGFAWSENAGWINFNPTHGQVTIDPSTGRFDGFGWSETLGWIHFRKNSVPYGVKTNLACGTEICDGLDNDCDGETDEGFNVGTVCEGVGECGAGQFECDSSGGAVCSTDPEGSGNESETEICNAVDDDCDGETDEGFNVGTVCEGVGECGAGQFECDAAGGAVCSTDPEGSGNESETEICNAVDDDCDGETDEGFNVGTVCEGVGECGAGQFECDAAGGAVCSTDPEGSSNENETEICNAVDDDCDGETDEGFNVGTVCEGVGECGAGQFECDSSGGAVCSTDPEGSGNESETEICNAVDDDCDGETDEGFNVGTVCEGVGECGAGQFECDSSGGAVCSTDPEGSGNESETEICNAVDDDCDGETDEGFNVGTVCEGVGECGAGQFECDGSGGAVCSTDPEGSGNESETEICNAVDDDCDEETDEGFNVGTVCEGVGECGAGQLECDAAGGAVCSTDPEGSGNESETEICNAVDDDCDGETDEGFNVGTVCEGVGECGAGQFECDAAGGAVCSTDPEGSANENETEICNAVDDDCDGETDEGFNVGTVCEGVGECGAGQLECDAAGGAVCSTDPEGSGNESETEICNAVDDDCDGETDEGFNVGTVCEGVGECGAGLFECDAAGGAVCSTDPEGSGNESSVEICDDLDNDCDGTTDEDAAGEPLTQGTTCGVGECAGNTGIETCSGGAFGNDTCDPLEGAVIEVCDGLDDDCDGAVDNDCDAFQMEAGSVTVGGTHVTVPLINTYFDPIVVATVQYSNNTKPVVTRVSNVTATSFDVRLQNPSGVVPAAENVSYWVVERGVWTVDGVKLEADRYLSTQTQRKNAWFGSDLRTYGQGYVQPVVVGQVMSENDPRWSMFFAHGVLRTDPPSATTLKTGKHIGEDTAHARANETIGYIVVEAVHTNLAAVEFEAAQGLDTILGVSNGPPFPYNFNNPFGTAPTVVVASSAGMDGGDGGWAQVHGPTMATTTRLNLSIDEDQIADTERTHTSEQVTYAAFSGPMVYPVPPMCNVDLDCDDGLYCNGAEQCDGNQVCRPGDDPCPGQLCDENSDSCIAGVTAKMESVSIAAGNTSATLVNSYASPVIACTPVYDANSVPVVVRVDNVTGSSFSVSLQNPGDLDAVADDPINCLVVEEGSWMMDGHPVEAHKYTSVTTDKERNWLGVAQSLSHGFTNPVVLGQVMSTNDTRWSVYWQRGTAQNQPPSASALRNGKTVCEDPDGVRADETIGFIVFEQGNGTIAGVTFEAALGPDTVAGVDNGAPFDYAFNVPFSGPPAFAVATQAGMDGSDGSWAYLYGSSFATATQLSLAVDEDQIFNVERGHTTEQVGYVAFETAVAFPQTGCATDAQCDDGFYCNGVETCNLGTSTCQAGSAVVCNDGVGCTDDTCNEVTDSCDFTTNDGNCDNGLFCDGAETCDAVADCQPGTDPCGGGTCDEGSDTCPGGGPVAQAEWGTVILGGSRAGDDIRGGGGGFVSLVNTYVDPVIVTSIEYANNNTVPMVTRINGVFPFGFFISLQDPSNPLDLGESLLPETVSYFVVEKGTWNMGGVKIEAQKYLSTKTAHDGDWSQFDVQFYGQAYTAPAVLGQVMTLNDTNFSAFWSRGPGRSAPPTATDLRTGKMVGEDTNTARANETIGFVVVEGGHGFLGTTEYECRLGTDSVASVTQAPPYPYTFSTSFSSAPAVSVVTQSAMDGFNGGWMYTFGPGAASATTLNLAGDEDQLWDVERSRATESAAYCVFQTAGSYP